MKNYPYFSSNFFFWQLPLLVLVNENFETNIESKSDAGEKHK